MYWDTRTNYTREELLDMVERLVEAGMDRNKSYQLVINTYKCLCKEMEHVE